MDMDTSPRSGGSVGDSAVVGYWLGQLQRPVVMRIAPGIALLLLAMFFGTVSLAYWVGESRGYKRGTAGVREELAAAYGLPRGLSGQPASRTARATAISAPPVLQATGTERIPHASVGSEVAAMQPGAAGHWAAAPSGGEIRWTGSTLASPIVASSSADARVPGQNYFVIHYPEAYAKKLVVFLWREGIEAEAIKPRNSKLYQVIALQGFSREDLDSTARKQYEQTLHRVGRTWKAQNPDATDLSGIYLDRFDGEPVEAVITRGNTP